MCEAGGKVSEGHRAAGDDRLIGSATRDQRALEGVGDARRGGEGASSVGAVEFRNGAALAHGLRLRGVMRGTLTGLGRSR